MLFDVEPPSERIHDAPECDAVFEREGGPVASAVLGLEPYRPVVFLGFLLRLGRGYGGEGGGGRVCGEGDEDAVFVAHGWVGGQRWAGKRVDGATGVNGGFMKGRWRG